MKPTKEFKEWYIILFDSGKPSVSFDVFEKLKFEFQEGVYRAYFREKGYYKIVVKEIVYRPNMFRGYAEQGFLEPEVLDNKTIRMHNIIETKDIYKTYPEAFEALVNKLFEI